MAGPEAEITKVTDHAEIIALGILRPPRLVIDRKVVTYGRCNLPATSSRYCG